MWKKLVVLFFLASAVKCAEQVTYEEQVAAKVSAIDASKANVIGIYNIQLSNLQNIQLAINSIVTNLPTSIINDSLAGAFSVLEAISAVTVNSDEQYCLRDVTTKKQYMAAEVGRTIKTCVQNILQTTSQISTQTTNGITKINDMASFTRSSIFVCGNNSINFRLKESIFQNCIDTAVVGYITLVNSCIEEQITFTTKRNSILTDIVKCETQTIIETDKSLKDYVNQIKSCLKNSPVVELLNRLIATETVLADNTFTDQLTKSTEYDKPLEDAKAEELNSLEDAMIEVTAANTSKSVTLVSAMETLSTVFNTSKAGFDKAVADFASKKTTVNCVNNITNAIPNTINRVAAQYVSCVAAIQYATLSSELNQIQQLNSQSKSKEGETALQCVAKVNNLFIDEGIVTCRQEAQADVTTDYQLIKLKALSLKQKALLVTTVAENCKTIAINLASRQISRDKLSFENCILKITKIKYKITIA